MRLLSPVKTRRLSRKGELVFEIFDKRRVAFYSLSLGINPDIATDSTRNGVRFCASPSYNVYITDRREPLLWLNCSGGIVPILGADRGYLTADAYIELLLECFSDLLWEDEAGVLRGYVKDE